MQMLNLPVTHPILHNYLLEEGFTASLSGLPNSKIPCDQIIEMTINRHSKDTGGLSGKTENVGASERWARINHIMAALRGHLDNLVRRREITKHVDFGEKRMLDNENDVQMLSHCLNEWVPGLWEPDQPLVHIATGVEASLEVDNVKTIRTRGKDAMSEFISRFTYLVEDETVPGASYYDSIKRQEVISFKDNKKIKKNVTIQ